MFGLIRRISGSIIPRPDRPWEEDATSNAPKVGRKRRRDSGDGDEDAMADTENSKKKVRGDTPLSPSCTPQRADSEAVKEVTAGVKEVELEDHEKAEVQPESVPLPEEVAGELDSSSIASTPPPDAVEDEEEEKKDAAVEVEAGTKESDDDETKVGDATEAVVTLSKELKEPSKEPVTEDSTDATDSGPQA